MANTAATSRTRGSSSTRAESVPPPAAAPDSPGRVTRLINAVGGLIGGALSPSRAAPADEIGASPFNESNADSTISGSGDTVEQSTETDESNIARSAAEDYAEEGDGGLSDVEGGEVDDHYFATAHDDDEEIQMDERGEELEQFEMLLFDINFHCIPGAPKGWQPPQPPDTWQGYNPKANAPLTFEEVDNPGQWNSFCYRPRYATRGNKEYLGHWTPCGAKVVPPNEDGRRVVNGWEFFYNGWKPSAFDRATYVRGDATQKNLFPDDRNGCLDAERLKAHGLTKERMNEKDAFFFLQLLLPVGDTSESNVPGGDGRMPFFTHASQLTNTYAFGEKGWGNDYGHKYTPTSAKELVHWVAVPIRHGARGGKPSEVHTRWMVNDTEYDSDIANSITHSRYKQLKSTFKLNNNMTAVKKGQLGYDPACKYDYIYQAVCHNMNYFTKYASLDLAGDESTWGFAGFGEVVSRLINKPYSKGGQTTFLFDIRRRYPRAYVHRHKHQPRPDNFKAEGKFELWYLMNQVTDLLIKPTPEADVTFQVPSASGVGVGRTFSKRRIFSKCPHFTVDNHFSGDDILDEAGKRGFGITGTVRRDRFPAGLKEFVHSEKVTASTVTQAKVMRFQNPIFAIKQVEATDTSKAYTKTHCSFQSTGPTNIGGVNNLPSGTLYVSEKTRGQKPNVRHYGIEQNEPRQTYLGSYWGIDAVDHMIKIAGIRYITWKYWHAPYLHCLSIAVCAAYNMYLECTEGMLDEEWKVEKDKRMSYREFRLKLSVQMLAYDPTQRMYPNDEKFRDATNQPKAKRKVGDIAKGDGVNAETFQAQKRLCGTLDELEVHVKSIERKSWAGNCEVCGKKAHYNCRVCNIFVCSPTSAGDAKACHVTIHNDSFFGLARCDSRLHNKAATKWQSPSTTARKRNKTLIERIKEVIMGGGD